MKLCFYSVEAVDMNLYDVDYELWLDDQLEKLKTGQWKQLDIEHLVEELESLNKSNKRELYSYLVVVLAHLLKWQFQRKYRGGSWKGSINNGRRRIERLFKDQPSLKPYLEEILSEAYTEAVVWASEETGLDVFPNVCPYSIEEMLTQEFLPNKVDG
jgi:hypothetical protein